MPIVIDDIEQGTQEWFDLKLGIPSASCFGYIVTSKGEKSKSWDKYMDKLVNEKITRRRSKQWELSAFNRGKEMEPESRDTWELKHRKEITQVAFVFKDERKLFGCSPDGLVDWDGGAIVEGFETKDAIPRIQYERLLAGVLPTIHHRQVQGSLYVCEAERWHFRSYCSGMRPMDIVVERDEKFIKKLADQLEVFCYELQTLVEKYKTA
jgi:hypothetical protein